VSRTKHTTSLLDCNKLVQAMDKTPKHTRETGTPEPKDPWEWGTGKPKGETITVGGKEHVIVSAKAKGSAKGKPGAKARARKAYMQQKRALRAMKSAEKLRIKHSKERYVMY
jgi:prolyl oligopeptidase PreP (S9A serine peptidase family)